MVEKDSENNPLKKGYGWFIIIVVVVVVILIIIIIIMKIASFHKFPILVSWEEIPSFP